MPSRLRRFAPDWLAKLPESGKLRKIHSENMPEFVAELTDDDFVVCMTMGHATDRPILQEIFRQGRQPAYLGVIGSEAKRKVMVRETDDRGAWARNWPSSFAARLGCRWATISRAKSRSA